MVFPFAETALSLPAVAERFLIETAHLRKRRLGQRTIVLKKVKQAAQS
ncbi:hypothetical protein [Shewanella dokdonensis]|nr:hypothetical protein [Shewanella dokdonensis]MCL1074490.1 hypothetical protein [Shewanella dokdonensis]